MAPLGGLLLLLFMLFDVTVVEFSSNCALKKKLANRE
jgi:hypothetical protein